MSEAQVFDKSVDALQTKPIREVAFALFSKSPNKDADSLRRTALQHSVMGVAHEEADSEEKEEKIAKMASEAFNVQHDPTAAAMAIAIYSRNVVRDSITPLYGKLPKPEERAEMLEKEQAMREALIKKAGLPEDFFETNGFLTPVK